MTTEPTPTEPVDEPTPPAKSRSTAGVWVLALLVAGAVGVGAGHQWGLHDREVIAVDLVAAEASPSPSSSSSSSSSSNPSPSSSAAAKVAPACKQADKFVQHVVRRSDIAAEHPEPTDDGVTACRWRSATFPRVIISVVAMSKPGDVVAVLDDRWTDGAPMENERMYQYGDSSVTGYWKDPDSSWRAATIIDGMNSGEFPTDEGMAATSLAARIAQAAMP